MKFVSADNGGISAGGAVTWTLANVPAGEAGKVTLTVEVLESALVSNGGPGKVVNGGETATVKVGNDDEFTLETVENPVEEEPHKREIQPYTGTGMLGEVNVGDEITYEITYTNYKTEAADVVIKDTLDSAAYFLRASDGGSHDAGTHTVTWKIANVPAGTTGRVTVTIRVRESALAANGGNNAVTNGGSTTTVQVGNDSEKTVETVSNPVATVSVTVRKEWDDEDDAAHLRPKVIKVTLSNGDVYYLSEENQWTVTVTGLPRYANGEPIHYTWHEQSVPGYTQNVEVRGNTTVFINTCVINRTTKRQSVLYTFDELPTALGVGFCFNHVGDNFE